MLTILETTYFKAQIVILFFQCAMSSCFFCVFINMFGKSDGCLLPWMSATPRDVSEDRNWWLQIKKKVEGKKEKKLFLGGIKMFSVSVTKRLYCHATLWVYCRYIRCGEVGFSQ